MCLTLWKLPKDRRLKNSYSQYGFSTKTKLHVFTLLLCMSLMKFLLLIGFKHSAERVLWSFLFLLFCRKVESRGCFCRLCPRPPMRGR
jgi:hypothetical protein